MRLRKLALAVGATAALVSNLGFALGLGEIKLNSALNQPLDAQIKLLQVRDLSEEEIIVRLATREAYERANVERIFFLTGLKFEVVLDDPNNPYVRVTTKEDVREPYLNFLLETQWPTGRMLREYTVLMDLPTFSQKNQKAVTAPQQEAVTSAPQEVKPRPEVRAATPAPVTPRPAAQTRPASKPAQVTDGSYEVQRNDTLWDIALMARPDRSYSVQQTMLAIQRLNPDAFINDNINLLKKGKVLRLPAADEIASLSTRQAINEVAYQNNQWSGGAALDASSRSGSVAEGANSREGRVQLSSGQAATDVAEGSGNSRQREILQNELAIAQEELGSARRQNTELVSRVEDLESQITTMERMLEVTSEELRALQISAGQEVTEPAPTEESAPESEVVKPEPAKPANTVVRAPAPEPTLLDMVMDNILYVGLALLALLGGLFFWKRRSDAEAEQEAFDAFAEDEQAPEGEFTFPDDSDFDSAPQIEDEPVEAYEEEETAEAETADVAGEADIYIAYGKYDQAEDMLLKALDEEPGRVDVRLKLLEVYAETQNLEAFDSHYGVLLDQGDKNSAQRAEELRDSIPGAGQFDRTQVAAVGTAAAVAGSSFDLDDDVDPLLSLAEEGIDEADFDGLEGLDSLESDFGDLAVTGETSLDLDTAEVSDNIDDLDFTLDGLDDESAEQDEEFSLDLDDSGAGSDEGLALDLDSEGTDDFSLDLDADSSVEDFSLDLDDLEDEPAATSAQSEASSGSDLSLGEDDDFTLSLDDDLELSLDADGTAAPATEESLDFSLDDAETESDDDGFDLSLDDELNLDTETLAAGDEAGAADELSVDADDFDANENFGDMDLAALDQEMESLSAGMDLDDDLSALDSVEDTATSDEIEEFDISADLGIEDGADELPPLAEQSVAAHSSDLDLDDDGDAELGFLADSDEVATKLDLARAYIDMGDSEGARDILAEVMDEGDDQQKGEASELLGRIG